MTISTATFPSERDFARLLSKPDSEILSIWRSLMHTSCGCVRHSFADEAQDTMPTEWLEAVQSQLIRRGLPETVDSADADATGLICQTCSNSYQTFCPPDGGPEMYLVCRPCGSMRLLGNHMDCTTGPVVALPSTW